MYACCCNFSIVSCTILQDLQGKEMRKRNRGNIFTWEEVRQYLEFPGSFCLFLSLMLRWEVYVPDHSSPRNRKVCGEWNKLCTGTSVSVFVWRSSQHLLYTIYRTKLRFGDNGLSPRAAGHSIYHALLLFYDCCIQVMDVKMLLNFDTGGDKLCLIL